MLKELTAAISGAPALRRVAMVRLAPRIRMSLSQAWWVPAAPARDRATTCPGRPKLPARPRSRPFRPPLRVLALGLALMVAGAPAADDEGVTLNFQDADLDSVISMVSEETGINFIVDPRVQGEITIVSNEPVSRDEVYQIFLAALRMHGFNAVPADGAVKLVPDSAALQDRVPAAEDGAAGAEQIVTRVLHVEHVQAAQLVPVLRPLVPQAGHLAALEQSNSLVIADSAANVQRLARIIDDMDRDLRGDDDIHRLEHASAAEVARLLENLRADEHAATGRYRIAADERSNSIIISGDEDQRLRARALISQLDTELTDEGSAEVVYLRYSDAEELAAMLQGLGESLLPPQTDEGPAADLNIEAHASTNSLVLNGPPDVVRGLQAVIRQLDIRRAQVLIEGVIAEITTEQAAQLGIQWGAGNEETGVGLVNFSNVDGGILDVAAGVRSFAEGGDDPPAIGDGLTAGGGDLDGSSRAIALIQALASDSASNILSTPSLMTMDNEEAEIVVGQNVPFITGRAIEDSGQAFSTIQREDVGVQLTVRPQINEGDAIKLEIEQEVSTLTPGTEGAADLVTDKRSLKTSVMVDDGQMVVLGGLLDDSASRQTRKVPGLGDIPWLGRLFRFDRNETEKRNLMVFLHPTIATDAATQSQMTSRKYSQMRVSQQGFGEDGLPLLGNPATPELPPLETLMDLPEPYDQPGRKQDAPGIGRPPLDHGLLN